MKISLLDKFHNRDEFYSGKKQLDDYLKQLARQEMKKYISSTYVLAESDGPVLGYYSLSSYSVNVSDLPLSITKKLPRYPLLPATLLGRLAISNEYQGKGYGRLLLMDALHKSLLISRQVGSIAVIVEAIDAAAINFYKKYGFQLFQVNQHKLFMPMKFIENLF